MGLESQPIVKWKYDELEPIPRHYGLSVMAFTTLTFFIINRIVHIFGPPKVIPQKDAWQWTNLFCSWLHALIIGTWDILCFVLYPELMTDLIGYFDMFSYMMIAVSTGYFLYDFFDVIISRKGSIGWEVLLHHLAVAGTFFYNIMNSRCIAYTVVALQAEVNSFFLHSRKLMQMLHVPFDSPLYRVNVYFNAVTFVICRFAAMTWIVYGMVVWADRVEPYYLVILYIAMFIMFAINIVLFWRIVANDFLRKSKSKHEKNGVKLAANNNGSLNNHNGTYDKLVSNHINHSASNVFYHGTIPVSANHINGCRPKQS